MIKKFQNFLTMMVAILSIMGIVTFSLFILEESFQTIMFGTWPAKNAKRWDVVMEGTIMMEKVANMMEVVNNWAGWIQPLAYISYGSYAKSADFYIKGLRAEILAKEPELFIGRNIDFVLKPKSWKSFGSLHMTNTKIRVLSKTEPTRNMKVSGLLVNINERLYVYNRE